MEKGSQQPLEVVYCYSQKDLDLLKRLDNHLASLRKSGLISCWYDAMIKPGEPGEQIEREHLESADIILLLVSSDFLSSDSYQKVVSLVMERYDQGKACVIPVPLRPANWDHELFSHLKPLPAKTPTIIEWSNPDAAFANVAKGILQVTNDIRSRDTTIPQASSQTDSSNTPHFPVEEHTSQAPASPYHATPQYNAARSLLNQPSGASPNAKPLFSFLLRPIIFFRHHVYIWALVSGISLWFLSLPLIFISPSVTAQDLLLLKNTSTLLFFLILITSGLMLGRAQVTLVLLCFFALIIVLTWILPFPPTSAIPLLYTFFLMLALAFFTGWFSDFIVKRHHTP